MMEVYHEPATTTVAPRPPAHYHYVVIPPTERLLLAIGEHCGVGGTIRPRNRTLADWANYRSAGHVGDLLDQLACDGWIQYDRATGLITLLFDPSVGSVDPEGDQLIPAGIDSEGAEESDDSTLIPSRDRALALSDAENESIPMRDQNAPRMEDSCLAAADHDSDSAAARYKIPCSAESIPTRDHRAVLLSELGTAPKLIAKALEARPDLTPAQIRATWSHFEPRIAAGLCSAGAFHAAIANGQIHAAPPDPERPLDPARYTDDPAYQLGSAVDPPEAESIRDHAARLLPKPTADTIREHTRDWMFLQGRIGAGDTDDEALQALASYRKRVRGAP